MQVTLDFFFFLANELEMLKGHKVRIYLFYYYNISFKT